MQESVESMSRARPAQRRTARVQPYTLWFTGFAPANDPQVAVAVVVENGGGRGQSGFGKPGRRTDRQEGH